ncbi:hypothetical protein Tco_0264481 [Tanacetum coccineum]
MLCSRDSYEVMPLDTYSVQAPSGGVTDWYQKPRLIRGELYDDTFPPITDLPVLYDDTLLTPTIPTIPPVASTILYTSPFIDTDSSSSDSSSRYSSSGYAILDSLDDSSTATYARPSCKRCRSPTSSVPVVLPIRGALSLVRADLSPLPKRIRDSYSVIDLEIISEDGYEPYVPREVGLGVDFEDSYEPYIEPDIDSNIQADIDECIMYAVDPNP